MAQDDSERNEYDHKVIYSDLFSRIKSVKAEVSQISDKIKSELGENSIVINSAGGTYSYTYKPSQTGDTTITLADTAFTGVANVGEGILTLKVAKGAGTTDLSKTFGANSSENVEFSVPLASTTTAGVVKVGGGLKIFSDGALATKPRIFTTQPTNPEEGDIWIKDTSQVTTIEGPPSNMEGLFIYTGETISGTQSTFIIESVKVGNNYYLQKAYDVSNTNLQYTRILKGDGNLVANTSTWNLGYANWA